MRDPVRDPVRDPALRSVLGVLAASAVLVGGWAQLAPASFHARFPGLGHAWVAVDGPYSEHLVRDVGGLFLALAVQTTVAAVVLAPVLVRTTAAAWLVFAVPHLAYHLGHLEPFGTVDRVGNVVALAVQVAFPAAALVMTRSRARDRLAGAGSPTRG